MSCGAFCGRMGVLGPLFEAVLSLYGDSLVRITSSNSNLVPVGVGLCRGCPLSQILLIIFMDTVSTCSQETEGSPLWWREDHLCFLALPEGDFPLSLLWFPVEYEVIAIKISLSARKRWSAHFGVGMSFYPKWRSLGILWS